MLKTIMTSITVLAMFAFLFFFSNAEITSAHSLSPTTSHTTAQAKATACFGVAVLYSGESKVFCNNGGYQGISGGLSGSTSATNYASVTSWILAYQNGGQSFINIDPYSTISLNNADVTQVCGACGSH